jgi:hypothetical protein
MRIPTEAASVQPPRHLTGPELSRWVRRAGATTRAHLAEELRNGSLRVIELTAGQAKALTKVNAGYISTVHKLALDDSARLERGSLTLAELSRQRHNGNGHHN